MIHNRKDLQVDPETEGWNVVISGHSHKPSIEETGSLLWLTPGTAGPRRFRLPITLAFSCHARGMPS
jgi:predicted phosphodiesterase